MGSALLGVLLGMVLLVASILHMTTKRAIFWDVAGIMIVFGGTLSAALITFSLKEVISIGKICWIVLLKNVDNAPALVTEIITLARETRGDVRALQGSLDKLSDPFLKDGVQLIIDRHDLYKIETILRDRIRVQQERDESTANILRTLAKYPPALGIVGTVIGLIALLQELGGSVSAENLGPAMAVGLVATLYGLVLTNFILTPMGENMALKSYKEIRKRQIILTAILALKSGESALYIQEALNSFLPPAQRVDVLGVSGGGQGSAQGQGRAS